MINEFEKIKLWPTINICSFNQHLCNYHKKIVSGKILIYVFLFTKTNVKFILIKKLNYKKKISLKNIYKYFFIKFTLLIQQPIKVDSI